MVLDMSKTQKHWGWAIPKRNTLLSCSVSKPSGQGCLISKGLIWVPEVLGLLLLHEGPGFYLVDFSPESGSTLTTITIDGCTNTTLNNKFKVNGTARGLFNNTNIRV